MPSIQKGAAMMQKTQIHVTSRQSLAAPEQDDVVTDTMVEAVASLVQELPGGWSIFRQQLQEDEAMLLISPAIWGRSEDAVTVQRTPAGLAIGLSEGDTLHDIGLAHSPWSALVLVGKAVRHRAQRLSNAA
jgi:hypothetical protein